MGRAKRKRNRRNVRKEDQDEYFNILQLHQWLGIKNMHFKVTTFKETGRGVLSDKTIHPGDELVAIPLEAMVTIDVVNRSNVPKLFNETFTSPEMAISFWLLYERHMGNKSSHFNYLNVLPKTFDTLLFCANDELKVLPNWIQRPAFAKLKEAVDGHNKSMLCLQTKTCDHCNRHFKDIFAFDLFLWAWTCVNTRCVYYEDEKLNEDGEMTSISSIAMAPFLDFFNHSNTANVEAKLECERRVYSLKTNTPYKKNEQIFIKYGAFPNLRLLVEYGFISDDETQDVVEFLFEEILKAAKMVNHAYAEVSKLKYKFINVNSLNVQLSKSKDEFSWNCNGLLYILVTQDTNLDQLLSKTYSSRWSEDETEIILKIQQILINQKVFNLRNELEEMEKVGHCTKAFTTAKTLVKQYISILLS